MFALAEEPKETAKRRITVAKQTVRRFDAGADTDSDTARFSFAVGPPLSAKSVDYVSEDRVGLVDTKGPDAGTPAPDAGTPAPDAGAPAKKSAGVDSFSVKWTKNVLSSPTVAKLRLDYAVKFAKDATHDPAVAEFRQNEVTVLSITAGPNKGFKFDDSPMHDDNYSRTDDTQGHGIADVDFASNDNPGASPIDKDDVVDYSFTAEQMILDTSDGNKVIAKRGPHTGTIKGKDPRAFGGVPTTL